MRFNLYRRGIELNPATTDILELKIADTQAELESCFELLHNVYVASGFMRPHPSGLRVTPYHALPTTTTLCAKVNGQVVGTLSIVRDGVFGFPMQSAFDIASVREKEGRIAEISALAIHPSYRKTGGSILFPLMKFMFEYCTKYFDTRHLLIAVNPSHIEMYESLLFFRRLTADGVSSYDFANGAPAIGATLDLHEAPAQFELAYAGKPGRRNLHHYFVHTVLPGMQFPVRPWHISNDPVLTPALMHHFFVARTHGFDGMDERKRHLLHSIYTGPEWSGVLPALSARFGEGTSLRRHPRFSLKCPGSFSLTPIGSLTIAGTVIEMSAQGFQARLPHPLTPGDAVSAVIELGQGVMSRVVARVVRQVSEEHGIVYGFAVETSDAPWQHCVAWLDSVASTTLRREAAVQTECGRPVPAIA